MRAGESARHDGCGPAPVTGKCYVVTGASSGIGLDVAQTLLRGGARVLAFSRSRDRFEQGLLAWARDQGLAPQLQWQGVDFSDPPSLGAVDWASLPVVDGLVNSAGTLSVLPLRAETLASVSALIDVNLTSPIEMTRSLLKSRRFSDGASLVYLSSINGTQVGAKGHSVYAATKGGLKGFVMALSQELAPRRIRVNAVAPGLVRTRMHGAVETSISAAAMSSYEASYPLGIGLPGDVSGLIAFVLSDASRWITGQTLVIDGGVSVS